MREPKTTEIETKRAILTGTILTAALKLNALPADVIFRNVQR